MRTIMKTITTITTIILFISFLCLDAHTQNQQPVVSKSVYFGKTIPIRDMPVIIPGKMNNRVYGKAVENPSGTWDNLSGNATPAKVELDVQDKMGSQKSKGPLLNFEGMDNVQGWVPADPNGDVGVNYYIQTINNSFSVYEKTGELVYGPIDNTTIWANFPGPWDDVGWGGDPVFKYDQMAGRWLMTAFSLNFETDEYYQLAAVSVSEDPLGEYYCYAFLFNEVNDYPKVGIWNDAYYITYNMFDSDWNYLYIKATALDKEAMLAGEPEATMIEFDIYDNCYTLLSADMRGFNIPENEPNYLICPYTDLTQNPYPVILWLYEFVPNWSAPLLSTFNLVNEFDVGEVSVNIPNGAEQPGNIQPVETMSARMMYPVTYRKFDTYESMVACHTLWNEGIFYIRWYELRKTDEDWSIYQVGSYQPDTSHRYEPSISINGKGDIGLGFTISDLEMNPSIRVTGRRADDPPGEMTFEEINVFAGINPVNNVANGRNRWGDYTSMNVDPVDDSTFWYTSMYPINNTSWGNWSTRIVAYDLSQETTETEVWAGNDTAICIVPIFNTQAEASNYNSLFWTTNGDGNFTINHVLNSWYSWGDEDLENGQVTLTLHAGTYTMGEEVTDSMILYINQNAIAYAGADDTICKGDSYTLQGEVDYSEVTYWTSSGDGTFNDQSLINAIYTPGPGDEATGSLTISLDANPIDPCPLGDVDEMVLTIDNCTGLEDHNLIDMVLQATPNPTNGLLKITVNKTTASTLRLDILDIKGNSVFTDISTLNGKAYTKNIDLQHLEAGIYFVRVVQPGVVKTLKVVKK